MPVNWSFIEKEEGGSTRVGYVPYDRDKDNSGVTIGMGIDLGWRSEGELINNFRLPAPLINKLVPYLGKRGDKAREYIKFCPLVLTEEEAKALNFHTLSFFEEQLKRKYDSSSTCLRWDDLSTAQQTVIMSVYFQHGPQMFKYDFWDQAIGGRWYAMINNLKDFRDAYGKRRKREALYLETFMLY